MEKAKRDIFSGTEWLDAEQAGAKGCTETNTSVPLKGEGDQINCWKAEKKIFVFQREGTGWYPRYQFNNDYMPFAIMQEIVSEFGTASPVEIAAWMESSNNYLDGKRPRDLLGCQRSVVLDALGKR